MDDVVGLFTEGGTILANPSSLGGTWAYCHVNAAGQRVLERCGVLSPDLCGGQVSNHVSELYALVLGLESVRAGWSGTVYADNWNALQQVFHAARLRNLPRWLVDRLHRLQRDRCLIHTRYVLLDAHPTQDHLRTGVGRRGRPVSPHNIWCDLACRVVGLSLEGDYTLGMLTHKAQRLNTVPHAPCPAPAAMMTSDIRDLSRLIDQEAWREEVLSEIGSDLSVERGRDCGVLAESALSGLSRSV